MRGLPDQKRMAVAGVEVVGGLYGLAVAMPQLVNSGSWPARLIFGATAGFYLASFVAGILLMRRRREGIILSIYLTYPQLLLVKTSLLTFALHSGARTMITLPLGFKVDFGSGFEIGYGSRMDGGFIGLNILALYFLLLLVEQREILDAPPPVDRVVASSSNELPE
jgi:hypothetical protein